MNPSAKQECLTYVGLKSNPRAPMKAEHIGVDQDLDRHERSED